MEVKDETPEEVEVVVDVKEEAKVESKTENTQKTKANDEIVSKLKELAELKEMGVITEDEFNEMKKRLIENFYK